MILKELFLLPASLYSTALTFKRQQTARKIFPNLSTPTACAGYISIKYNLEQAAYFAQQGEWAPDALIKKSGHDLLTPPAGCFPWHVPALQEIRRMQKNVMILDICCGMPTFLDVLWREGYKNLVATEDNSFMPNVVQAAREYCKVRGFVADILNVRTGYKGDYADLLKTDRRFDVITNFGVAAYLYFPIIWDLLDSEGIFIAETYFEDVPKEFSGMFSLVHSYKEYGFRLRNSVGVGAVSVFRKL